MRRMAVALVLELSLILLSFNSITMISFSLPLGYLSGIGCSGGSVDHHPIRLSFMDKIIQTFQFLRFQSNWLIILWLRYLLKDEEFRFRRSVTHPFNCRLPAIVELENVVIVSKNPLLLNITTC